MAYVPTYSPTLRLAKGTELTWSELDQNFTFIADEFDLVQVETDVLANRVLNLEIAGGITGAIPSLLSDLTDVSTATPATGQALVWSGTAWTPTDQNASSVTTVFDKLTGTLSTTVQGAPTATVSLDGRYARTVNGLTPDASGNITLSLTATQTGTLASRPATAASGVVYIVSGDTAANNGKTYIWVTTGSSGAWYQVVSYDQAVNDTLYLNVSGDTMTGPLVLSGAPTLNLHAATKAYVDAGDAAKQPLSTTLTSLAGFNTNGLLTQTAANTFTGRTLTAGAGVVVTNGNGVAGNPTVAVSGLTTAELSAATLVTAAETIAANNTDTTIPTSAAVKGYVDAAVAAVPAPASKVLLGTLTWTARAGNVVQSLTGLNLAGYYGLEIGVNNVDLAVFTTAGGLIINGTNTGVSSTGAVSARIEVSFTPSVMWIASTNSYVNHTITAATTTLSFSSSQQSPAGGTVYVWGLR